MQTSESQSEIVPGQGPGLEELLSILHENCIRIMQQYSEEFNTNLTLEECFLSHYNPFMPVLPESKQVFWKNCEMFRDINALWQVELGNATHTLIENPEIFPNSVAYILCLVSGNFSITYSDQKFAYIQSLIDIPDLIPIIVLKALPELTLVIKILTLSEECKTSEDCVENYLKSEESIKRNYSCEKFGATLLQELVGFDGEKYWPLQGEIDELRIESRDFQMSSEEVLNSSLPQDSSYLRVIEEVDRQIFESNRMAIEEKQFFIEKEKIFNEETPPDVICVSPPFENSEAGEKFSEAISNFQSIEASPPVIQTDILIIEAEKTVEESQEVVEVLDSDLEKVKKNCELIWSNPIFQSVIEGKNYSDWIELLLDWHYYNELNENNLVFQGVDPYDQITDIRWRISLVPEIIEFLKKFPYKSRLNYIQEIMKLSKGCIIHDAKVFYDLNMKRKTCIIVDPQPNKHELPQLLYILCIERHSSYDHFGNTNYQYSLKALEKLQDHGEIQIKVERFLENSRSICQDLDRTFSRDSLRKFAVIQEDKSIIPLIELNIIREIPDSFTLYALYDFDDNMVSNIDLFITDIYNEIHGKFEVVQSDFDSKLKKSKLFAVKIFNKGSGMKFKAKMITKGYFKGADYYEAQEREFTGDSFQFLFNFQFVRNDSHMFFKNPRGTPISDPYTQLSYFASHLLQTRNLQGYSLLISYFAKTKNLHTEVGPGQTRVYHTINKYLSNLESPYDPYQLYTALSLLGLINVNTFKTLHFEKAEDLLMSMLHEFNNLLMIWKIMENFKQVIDGLKIVMACCKKQKFIMFLDLIRQTKDFILAGGMAMAVLTFTSECELELEDQEILMYEEIMRHQYTGLKEKILMGLVRGCSNFEGLFHILKKYQGEVNESIIGNKILKLFDKIETAEGILRIMITLKNLPTRIASHFNHEKYQNFLEKNLNSHQNIKTESVGVYKEIFELISETSLADLLNTGEIIEKFVHKFSFLEAKPLMMIFPDSIPACFEKWIKTIKSFNGKDLEIIDETLVQWDHSSLSTLCDIAIGAVFTKYRMNKDELILTIEFCKTIELKNSFKTKYLDDARKNLDHVAGTLTNFQNKNKKSEFLEDLLKTIMDEISPSVESLRENILKNPSEDFYWHKFLGSKKKEQNSKILEILQDFMSGIVQKVGNQTIQIFELQMISEQKEAEREAFSKYFRLIFDKDKDLNKKKDFNAALSQCLEEMKEIDMDVQNLSRLHQNFCSGNPEFAVLTEDFEAFYNVYSKLPFQEAKNAVLNYPFKDLAQKIKLVLNSVAFKHFFQSENLTSDDFEQEALNSYDVMIAEFEQILPEVLITELSDLTRIFSNLKNLQNIHSELKSITSFLDLDTIQVENLSQSLKWLITYKETQDFFQSLIDCKSLIYFTDENALQIIEDYIFTMQKEGLIVQEFIEKNDEIQNLLFFKLQDVNWKKISILLDAVQKSASAFEFSSKLEQEELDHLQEGLEQNFEENKDKEQVTAADILSLTNIWSFFSVFHEQKNLDFENYMRIVHNKLQEDKYQNILVDIEVCHSHLQRLTELHSDLNFQEKAKNKKITQILNACGLRFTHISSNFEIELYILVDNEYKPKLGMSELLELKDRALLSAHIKDSVHNEDKDNELQVFSDFVKLIDTIFSTLQSLRTLYQSCYRDKINFFQFFCYQGQYEELKQYELCNKSYNDELENNLKSMLEMCYWLNFLNGKQFLHMENYFLEPSEATYKKAVPMLKFMQKKPVFVNDFKKSESISERLRNINELIEGFPSEEIEIQEWPIPNNVISHHPGDVLICETKEFYIGVLSLFYNSGKGFPQADKVFFSNFYTKWNEINIFMNRCLINNTALYVLVNPENLSLDCQIKIKLKLNEMNEFKLKKPFYFAIVTEDIHSHLVNYLRYQVEIKIVNVTTYQMLKSQELKEFIKRIDDTTTVFTSAYVGLGKTSQIRRNAKILKKTRLEINISGNSTSESLGKLLKKAQKDQEVVIHLQLNTLENPVSVHELVFSLVIFKQFYYAKGNIYIPRNSTIFIEVANTFENSLIKSLPFLELLKQNHIASFDLNQLIINEKIQYVCKYLRSFYKKTLDNEDFEYSTHKNIEISRGRITQLLGKYFLQETTKPTYHQLSIFINILQVLLLHFEKSIYSALFIKISKEDMNFTNSKIRNSYDTIRSSIFASLLETTKEFTSKCADSVMASQMSAMKKISSNIKEEAKQSYENSIAWENSNHFTMLFLDQGEFLCIYRNPEMVPTSIKQFLSIQRFLENAAGKNIVRGFSQELQNTIRSDRMLIEDYNDLASSELMHKLISFYSKNAFKVVLNRRQDEMDQGFKPTTDFEMEKAKRLSIIESLGYVLTPDNFLKMNLIFLRCISDIPLIIMGETGCGKTSLIRFFVKEILQEQLEIICVHSGITSDFVFEKINFFNEQAKNLGNEKRLWVFFDEFNTSDCIGMLCDILCERKMRDVELSENLVFVGACNPYRARPSNLSFIENVGIKKASRYHSSTSQLVHIVKALPDKAIEYVWDFGVLKPIGMEKYIESMLVTNNCNHVEVIKNIILFAHNFFVDKEDVSSVSLRDVKRFIDLYKWFSSSLKSRKNHETLNEDYVNCMELVAHHYEDLDFCAGLLSLFHCYFLRISSKELRGEFLQGVADILEMSSEDIENIIKAEQLDYLSRMVISGGTAKNTALRENIFAIIPCILNKIPILICGKPGCSKSLAISLIVSGLRGDKSQDSYFKTLPELQIVSFQGSDSCTSEGISQVFERAKQFTKHKHLLPVVVFDEIGLAEISRHNPLKVLHELLENENRDVGFIGISNWRLDASKMNRALYLARPDPDQEDLTSTAVSILHSIVGESYEYEEFIRIIAESYFQLKEYFKTGDWADFYGLRDFYYLVKQLSNEFKKGPLDIYQVLEKIKRAIERNFGGKLRAAKTLGEIFCKKYQNSEAYKSIEKTQICDMITENLSEKDSRYLLLITRPDVASYLIESVLSAEIPDFRVLIGSKFEKDLAKEDSGFRALSDIIRYMERGISVILSNMDHTYSSLYDLFNQNFSKTGQRKYCRVALGAQFNPRCFVHDKFKVIVFMDESTKTLKAADAPFLNRFEKHHITLDEIIEVQQKNIADEINLWVENIFTFEQGPGKVLLNKVSIFPCFSKETIYLMVIFLRESGVQDEEITQICKNILLETAPIDVIILSQFSNLPSAEKEFINATWKEIHQVPFISYIQGLQGETIISLTYDVKNIDLELTEAFAEEITLQKVCNFQSEEDVLQDLRSFFKSERSNIYLLEMDYGRESVHFHLIISLIEKAKKEAMKDLKNQKNVCFLIRMSRNDTTRKPLSIFRLWNIRMFESLSTTPFTLTEEIITYDLSTIIQSENLIKFDELISEFAEISINSLKFQSAIYGFEEFSQQRDLIEKKLIEDPELAQGFKWKIFNAIEKNLKGRQELWGKQIFLDKQVVFEANCALDALKRYAAKFLVNQYLKLVFLIEKKSAFYSYSQICHHEELKNIWLSVFEKIGASDIMVQTTIQSNLVTFYKDLNFPFVLDEYSKVKDLYKLFANETENFTIENFIQNYREKSVWKDHLYLICENEELQQMIFKDFIKIVLHESVCVDIYVDEIFRIFLSIFRSESFEKKLLNFMEHKKFIMPLYKVLEIHMKCKGKHLDFEFENAEFFDLVGNLFDQIIEEIPPASDVIKNCKGQGNYLLLLQELELYFEKFDGLDLKSQQKHEFWMQICRINSIEKLLYSLASELYHQPFEYLTSNSFSDYLLEQVKKIEKTPFNLEKIQKFLLIYHCQLLDVGQGKPEHLIDEINSTEIWKYSSIFIDKLIEMAEISENIKWNERNPDMNQVIGDTENENVEVIEKLLGSLQDNFAVLLGDKLRLEFGEIDEEMIEAIPRLFRFYTSSLENEVGEFQNLSKIVALTRIRAILEWFSKRLFANKSNRAVLVDSYREMVRNLENSDFLYQLFVYKRVKFTKKWKNPKLVKSLIDLDIAWMDPLKEIAFTTDLTTFPIVEIDMALYKSLQLSIFTLSEDQNACDSILHSTKSSHSRLLLAIAFINCVFLQYHNSHFDPEPFISWFLAKQDLIRQELGHVFSTFLQNLIMNFPRGSFLFINPEIKQERIDLQAILLIIAETVAYCNTPNPISNMFFNAQGNFSIDTFNSAYCIGSEPEKIHNYLLYTLQNYDNLKNIGFSNRISKGGSYVCSENCDFLYIVNQCGGAMETKNCPFCGNEIGGKDHIIVKRKGHINLTDAEAAKFLKEKTNFYAKNEKVGFEVQGDLPITNVRTMRNRLGFHLANLITSSFLYFAVVTDLGDLGGLEMRYGSSRDALENMVKKNICQDFSEISAMISIEPTVWVLACASQLWTLMDAFVGKPASQEIRNSFEEKIESEILFKYQTLEILNRYKITLNQYTPQSNLLSQIDELEVPEGPSEYFRIIETPSFDTMTASFELSNKKSQLKVLSYFIENNAEIKNLKCLYPIVKLTNYLLEKYSFSISRYEASKKTLRSFSSTDPKLKILFEKFNIAWEKITLPLVNGCKTFEKLELTEETSLSYFLPDEDINGDGRYITAALKTIGNVQNNLLKLLIRENSHSSHPVQQCKRSDIISFSLGKKELTKQCSLNSLKYSMGREIIYDFDRMQLNIVSDIRNKKIFNTEDIYMVQYQFELLNTRGRYSGIISGIRENIKQESIGPTEIAQIEKKILFLSKRQGKEVKIVYKEIYSLFDKLFCNIQYSKNCEEIPVIEACKKVKGVSSYIAESQIFDGFQLNTIVALYEMIELNCYELIASFIGEMYKIDIDINVFEFEFRKMNEEFAGRTGERLEGEIEKVLKRIVLRLLSANVEPNFFIRDYLECEGFWSQEYLRYIDHVSSIFPQEYKLCQAVRIVEEIEENNKRAIRKLESVEETKVVKEQGIKKMKQSFNTGVKKKAKF